MKLMNYFASMLLLLVVSSVANAESVKAFWPINEGKSNVIHSTPVDYKGLFTGKVQPVWKGKELHFSGKKSYGAVKIHDGGKILSGPLFEISFDVKPAEKNTVGHLITCKHASTKSGGFYFHYWGAPRRLTFGFADGQKKYVFTATLKKKLEVGKWSSIKVVYDGSTFKMIVNDKTVLVKKLPGLILAKDITPMYIGCYVRPTPGMFSGSIRNLKLVVPEGGESKKGFVKASAGTPKIDGKLDDAVWKNSKFMSGFVTNCDPKRPAKNQTFFAISADKKNLYVAIRSKIDPSRALKTKKQELDSPKFWGGDTVELWLSPWGTDNCIQLAVNPSNSRQDVLYKYHMTRKKIDFDPKWKSATSIGKKEWIAEIAIPYDQIMVPPGGSDLWKFNVCRTDPTQAKMNLYSSWGQTPKGAKYIGFADANIFSALSGIPAPSYSAKQAKRVASAINRSGVDKLNAVSPFSMIAAAPTMFVPNNMVVPNVILTRSNGKVIMREKKNIRFRLDIPIEVDLLFAGVKRKGSYGTYKISKQEKPVIRKGKEYIRYELAPIFVHWAVKTIHLYMKSSLPDNSNSLMFFSSKWKGGSQPWTPIKLKIKKFPEPGIPRGIVASYAWMPLATLDAWPDSIKTLGKLGFNTVSLNKYAPGCNDDDFKKFAALTRSNGMKILAAISPFYAIRSKLEGNSTGADGKPIADIKDACPVYRGQIYQEDLKQIEDYVRLIKPDYVQFDIEKFELGAHNGKTGKCYRCTEVIKTSGKKPAEVMTDIGVQIAKDLRKAVGAGVAPNATPDCGIYHTNPRFVYEGVFSMEKLKNAGAMQLAHPVFYGTSPADAGIKTAEYCKILKDNKVYPWVSNGYQRMTPPELNYDMTMNVYGSGGGGMYWYGYERIEGADFYYYAKAMESVNPVSEILAKSKAFKLEYSAPKGTRVSGLRQGDKGVLLVVCGAKQKPGGQVKVKLPADLTGFIWSLPARKKVAKINSGKAEFTFTPAVKGTRSALYYVGK